MEIGYHLSSEEHSPKELVNNARRAEETGFRFALISDHYHPWLESHEHSPFVWSVIGAIAHTTKTLRLGTGVTCPTMRIHPAIIAQAAATAADMMPGRFFLGVGSGENLNEHILGDYWPPAPIRLEMLEEAIEVIRRLWEGEEISFYGMYYTVENARVYTLPEELPPIYMASGGEISAKLAGRIGDGLISSGASKEIIQSFEEGGGKGKPRFGKVDVCWAPSVAEARKTAHKIWANTGVKGQLNQELATPALIEQAASMVTEDDVAKLVICGPDSGKHIEEIKKYADSGYNHIYIHQIGPDQEGFFRFYEKNVLPKLN